jgi:hypothetical protein
LLFVAIAFVAVSIPRYLTLDPSRSLVPPPAGLPLHYPLLVAHVMFGSVAMLTCVFQVWPSFRRRHPEAHRTLGRIYVFCGVLPPELSGSSLEPSAPSDQ